MRPKLQTGDTPYIRRHNQTRCGVELTVAAPSLRCHFVSIWLNLKDAEMAHPTDFVKSNEPPWKLRPGAFGLTCVLRVLGVLCSRLGLWWTQVSTMAMSGTITLLLEYYCMEFGPFLHKECQEQPKPLHIVAQDKFFQSSKIPGHF
jgi:hypothetical protein